MELSNFFKLFSNKNRLEIFLTLFKNDRICVSEIVRITGISQSLVSQCLNKLKNSGIVYLKKCGNNHIYCLKKPEIIRIMEELTDYAKKI